jgi:hypothetical protein
MLRRLAVSALLLASLSQAALVRIEVKERSDVLAGYERVVGRAFFAVDPRLPANRIIVDIDKAPRNTEGQVEFSSDIYIFKPKDPRAGNGSVLFEVSNRGGKGMLGVFNRAGGSTDPRNERDFGDGFLFEQGYTLVWLGWQFDVAEQPNLMRLYAPVAKGVKGLVRAEITVDSKELSHSVADRNHRPYPVLNPGDTALKLTVRDRVEGERQTVPRAAWHIEDGTRIVMKEGFEPGRIYELVYTAQDPPVAGTGMAAMRDMISFLKYGGAKDEVLGDQNRYLKRAFAFGVSQSGRFLRTYLYNGFNQDERNRKAFDGIMAHVGGAGRGSFNVRFAQPSRDGHRWPAHPCHETAGLAQSFLHQFLLRILRPRCLVDPHQPRRQKGRALAVHNPNLFLRRRPARPGRVPAPAKPHPEHVQSRPVHLVAARPPGGHEQLGEGRRRTSRLAIPQGGRGPGCASGRGAVPEDPRGCLSHAHAAGVARGLRAPVPGRGSDHAGAAETGRAVSAAIPAGGSRW